MSIKQEAVYDISVDSLFKIFTNAADFAAVTGAPSAIDAKVGGAFSCFGGQISGRIIEIVPNERLVQAWRVEAWAPGVFSIARFTFAAEKNKTRVALEHSGFPEEAQVHLEQGWEKMYWTPIRTHLQS